MNTPTSIMPAAAPLQTASAAVKWLALAALLLTALALPTIISVLFIP